MSSRQNDSNKTRRIKTDKYFKVLKSRKNVERSIIPNFADS